MCNNTPIYRVKCVNDAVPGVVVLTVNRLFADLPQNGPFRLCLSGCILPRNNTGQVFMTDGILTLPVFMGCSGNFLRNDSLRDYLLKHRCSALNSFKGNDPPHVIINHRMCASSFLLAEEAPVSFLAAAPAPGTAAVETAMEKANKKTA